MSVKETGHGVDCFGIEATATPRDAKHTKQVTGRQGGREDPFFLIIACPPPAASPQSQIPASLLPTSPYAEKAARAGSGPSGYSGRTRSRASASLRQSRSDPSAG